MRILWHGPYKTPTGYWNQAEVWLKRLIGMGHEVAFSCLAGVTSHMETWRVEAGGQVHEVPVYPCTPYEMNGQDVVRGHYDHFKADLCITLTCTWVFNADAWRDMRVIHITPVDCEGMSVKDYHVVANSGGTPAAVCRWGETQMKARGLEPLYLPHGVETGVFRPPDDRAKLRKAMGLDHMFLVGINAGNHDKTRKRFNEAFGGFAAFHEKHPKSLLAVHSIAFLPGGLKLPALAAEWGISDAILFSQQYEQITGMYGTEELRAWYGALDVLLSVGNEGFGLPVAEAQACGTPVIAGNYSTGPELVGPGWLVGGQYDWNDHHEKRWYIPFITDVTAKLEAAYAVLSDPPKRGRVRKAAREFALGWDADRLLDEHWRPVFDSLQ